MNVEQRSIFSLMEQEPPRETGEAAWSAPKTMPDLLNVKRLYMDTETTGADGGTGTDPFKAKPVGIGLAYRLGNKAHKYYLPVGHSSGNLDPEMVKRYLNAELRGKEVTFLAAKFDIPVLRRFGVDLEALGVKPRDVAFNGALLDDNRRAGLDLASLALQYTKARKPEFKEDKSRMASYPAWMVGPYGEDDPYVTMMVDEGTMPQLALEGLERVLQVENDLIYFVCEIERNGCRVDVPKLEQWRGEIREVYEQTLWELHSQTGLMIQPGSGESLRVLFKHLNLAPPPFRVKKDGESAEEHRAADYRRSFTEEELLVLKHPCVNGVVQARRYADLLSRFLDKFHDGLRGGDVLFSQYHQLKGTEQFGTVSGRFSSSGGGSSTDAYTFNAQQTITTDLQKAQGTIQWPIRELFIPDDGMDYFSVDASQIEYRLFGHFANAPKIVNAYRDDPNADFHALVQKMLQVMRPGISRGQTKNVNFGKLYRAQPPTLAATAGISVREAEQLYEAMDAMFPEANTLSNNIEREARSRGYVQTLLGRRARLKDRYHSATNRVIQGSASDIMKKKLVGLYRERKTFGVHKLRQTVHDEQDGDLTPGEGHAERLKEFFDEQDFDLRIPIIWSLSTGKNWYACK